MPAQGTWPKIHIIFKWNVNTNPCTTIRKVRLLKQSVQGKNDSTLQYGIFSLTASHSTVQSMASRWRLAWEPNIIAWCICTRKAEPSKHFSTSVQTDIWDALDMGLVCLARKIYVDLTVPLPWASVHWLVQCTLECHWNATGWPSVHWDTTGPPSEYLQGTLQHHWKKLSWNSPHWNATGETLTFAAYTGTPLEGLWQPTQAPTHILKHAE